MRQINVLLRDMIACLSAALNAQNPALALHHSRVALVSARLGVMLGLDGSVLESLFLAALVHDLGVINPAMPGTINLEDAENEVAHAILGAKYLESVSVLADSADIVRYHHISPSLYGKYPHYQERAPQSAPILQAADALVTHVRLEFPMLHKTSEVNRFIREAKGKLFDELTADALLELSNTEAFWLELLETKADSHFDDASMPDTVLGPMDLEKVARLFALLVDTRSPFTATHTSGVAATAAALGTHMGWSQDAVARLTIAGLLHDLGKLMVPHAILNKAGKLDAREAATIRTHTFYTHSFLSHAEGLEDIALWAADHHEKLNGSGYPFRKAADELSIGSRIVAVADVFTAITEDRPYRPGMKRPAAEATLRKLVQDQHLDSAVADVLLTNYAEVNEARLCDQLKQSMDVRTFWRSVEDETRVAIQLSAKEPSPVETSDDLPILAAVAKA